MSPHGVSRDDHDSSASGAWSTALRLGAATLHQPDAAALSAPLASGRHRVAAAL